MKIKAANAIAPFVIVVIGLLIYHPIIFPISDKQLYPWASDTMGHILKAEYLLQNLQAGILYPNILPDWYLGFQMLRYHPPLPYYLLVGLTVLVSDSIKAVNWFILVCALVGGLTWLLYKRWLGFFPALFGGVLFLFLPDNIRVAMAEGNLPRVLATAMLPITIFFLLHSLEETSNLWHRIGISICFMAIVLSHAMMAAIYAVCAVLLVLLIWIWQKTSLRNAVLTIVCIFLGLLLSGWWLVPSFTGGIAELDTSAMTEALAVYPLTHYFNPGIRLSDPEAVYVGMAIISLGIAGLGLGNWRNGYTAPLTLTGLFGVLITTSSINQIFNALPLHNLLWPLRFLGIASFYLLLAVMWSIRDWGKLSPLASLIVIGIIAIDNGGSLSLIHLRPLKPDIVPISQLLSSVQGWRVATLDLSHMGSEPSYYFTALGGREQIFGWAYQGASTASTVASLNEAIEMGSISYLLNRLELYGVDDVVLLKDLPAVERLSFALEDSGFDKIYSGVDADLYHRAGDPRAFIANWDVLGIGRGAHTLSYLFPEIVVATSPRIDDYSLQDLLKYKTLILSGFEWQDRQRAETLVLQIAEHGVRVIVDMTGIPSDPWARIPRFLNVWGEQVFLAHSPLKIWNGNRTYTLKPFGEPSELWHTHMLQGLENDVWNFEYVGSRAVLAGFNDYGAGQVWFVGLNLPYHALISRDRVAIQLLAELLNINLETESEYPQVILENYEAEQDGYRFSFQLESEQLLFVPIAYLDGMKVLVDGLPTKTLSFERLVGFQAPAGKHNVEIQITPTQVYLAGKIASLLAVLGLIGLLFLTRKLVVKEKYYAPLKEIA